MEFDPLHFSLKKVYKVEINAEKIIAKKVALESKI
jgi:hypothetical protein